MNWFREPKAEVLTSYSILHKNHIMFSYMGLTNMQKEKQMLKYSPFLA